MSDDYSPEMVAQLLHLKAHGPVEAFKNAEAALERLTCTKCESTGWVCEDHPDRAWKDGEGCCGGAGAPCTCNELSKY